MNAVECFAAYRKNAARVEELLAGISSDSFQPDRVILAWERGGLLAPGWTEEGALSRLWINVAAHNAAVGRVAFCLSGGDPFATEGGLVHDAFKRREWEFGEEAKRSGSDRAAVNRGAELAGGTFLQDLGFPDDVVRASKTTGDLGLDLILAGGVTLAEKIVFYADSCVSGDQIVGYKQRLDDLAPQYEPGGRYEFLAARYREKFGGRTHRQVWDSVVLPLEEELVRELGFSCEPSQLYQYALAS